MKAAYTKVLTTSKDVLQYLANEGCLHKSLDNFQGRTSVPSKRRLLTQKTESFICGHPLSSNKPMGLHHKPKLGTRQSYAEFEVPKL
jgi:hypothetical protein